MAITHYPISPDTPNGRRLNSILTRLITAWNDYSTERAIMIQKKDNGASGDAVYASMGEDYFLGDDAAAKSNNANHGFAEIDSAHGTSDAAIRQMIARLL